MREALHLDTLTAAERAALRPDDRIVTADGTTHHLGAITWDTVRDTGEILKISARSHTIDAWLNLLTGHPVGSPRADEDLERVAAHYDATARAADLPAARRLADHIRQTAPESYAATLDADATENANAHQHNAAGFYNPAR